MRIVRSRTILAATALALLLAGLLGSFPHGHTAAPAATTAHEHGAGTHPPRPVRCLEREESLEPAATCALCLFQRIVSHGWVTPAPLSGTDLAGGDAVAQPAWFAVADPVSFGDPRAPPAT